jgi:hypothetical protein
LRHVLVGPVIVAVRPTTHARPDQTNDQDDECAVEQGFQVIVHRPDALTPLLPLPTHGFTIPRIEANVVEVEVEFQAARAHTPLGQLRTAHTYHLLQAQILVIVIWGLLGWSEYRVTCIAFLCQLIVWTGHEPRQETPCAERGAADQTGHDYLVNTMISLHWIDYILIALALLAAIYALRQFKDIER